MSRIEQKGNNEDSVVRFKEYLKDVIAPKELALIFRKYNFIIASEILENKELNSDSCISNAHYHINNIAEILDPYFEKND